MQNAIQSLIQRSKISYRFSNELDQGKKLSMKEELRMIAIEDLSVNPNQPRRHFKSEDIEELAESIRSVGLLHPPLVRPLENAEKYEIISGERRFQAIQYLGMNTIAVIVRYTTQSISAKAALIENIQRVDLNPLEISKALRSLITEFGLSQDELARQIGKKRSTVANYLRMLSLPVHIQDAISKDKITMGHAKAILALEGIDKQNLLYELILRDDLNVREAEVAAARIGEKAKKNLLSHTTRDFYLEQLEEKIRHKLGTKVSIIGKGKKGRIAIDYYNPDDLERLLELLGVNEEM